MFDRVGFDSHRRCLVILISWHRASIRNPLRPAQLTCNKKAPWVDYTVGSLFSDDDPQFEWTLEWKLWTSSFVVLFLRGDWRGVASASASAARQATIVVVVVRDLHLLTPHLTVISSIRSAYCYDMGS